MFREFHYQVRGRGHARDGTRGQDRTAYASRGGVQVLCLSDGAGSATHAEYGAQALVHAGCQLLLERFADFADSDDGAAVKLEIVRYLLARLSDVADRRGVGVKDLSATFLAVAISGDRFLAIHIGDGVVGYVKDGESRVASGPNNTEFVNQTTFVTSDRAAVGMRVLRGWAKEIAGFVLMSDGAASSLYNSRSGKMAPACGKLIATLSAAPTYQERNPMHLRELRRFIGTTVRQATKDDCAIGLLARPQHPR